MKDKCIRLQKMEYTVVKREILNRVIIDTESKIIIIKDTCKYIDEDKILRLILGHN